MRNVSKMMQSENQAMEAYAEKYGTKYAESIGLQWLATLDQIEARRIILKRKKLGTTKIIRPRHPRNFRE